MKIAVGNSRMDKKWKNRDISWEDLCARVGSTIRTTETVEEYRKLKKGAQDNIKDVGGFVGGQLREGRRKNGMVLCRSMLTLDMDYGKPGVWDEIDLLHDFQCCVYSTHKHTPEHPRLRMIIPLARDITEEEYPAVARMVAKEIGIDLFDDTTYEACRLMYWPSTSANGEFFYKTKEGPLLDPDAYLAKYADWHDASTWPVSSRQSEAVRRNITQQADPLEKPGIVGAFCRAYTIEEAIETFLSDVYEPSSMNGRYDYIPADSAAGVVVYDGKFAYSHHATDPVCGKLLNAFDLVRLHKFRELDENAGLDTPPGKLPSFKAMSDLALADDKVKAVFAEERIAQTSAEFSDEDWQNGLELDKSGHVKNTLHNLTLILENDPNLKGVVFNQLLDGMEIKGEVPWKHPSKFWRDADDAQLISYVDAHYGTFSARNYDIAVTKVADDRAYHPIREFIESLPEWDKVPRVDTLLVDYLGAADTAYVRAVTRKTLCAAISRVLRPGCKFDSMLVLNGPQGVGKSTLIAKLAGEWFSDSLNLGDTKDKTAAEKLQGYWILEIGELAGLKKAEVETLRSFLSRQNDIYRAAFGKRATPHLRQCVFFGTTNAESGYLRDTTGNRRFWPIDTGEQRHTKSVWRDLDPEIDQLWAEAYVRWQAGEPLYLSGAIEDAAKEKQEEHREASSREGIVREFMERPVPDDWSKWPLDKRRMFWGGVTMGSDSLHLVPRDRICALEVWCEAFGGNIKEMKNTDTRELNAIMAATPGWQKSAGTLHFGPYGTQRGFNKI